MSPNQRERNGRAVAVVAAGQTRFGSHPALGIKELFAEAWQELTAAAEFGFEPSGIDAAYIGTLGNGGYQLGHAAPLVMESAGLAGIPTTRVENACASGGYALITAVHAIQSGAAAIAIAGGVEKMTDLGFDDARAWLGVSCDTEYERLAGLTFPAIYALLAGEYLRVHRADREALSEVVLKNHENGSDNPKAHLRRRLSPEDLARFELVAEPLSVADCCPVSDGAAIVVLASDDVARDLTQQPVWIKGIGAGVDHVALHDRQRLLGFRAVRQAAETAFQAAGWRIRDVDLFEVHDCFSIAEVLAYEDLGLADEGAGWRLALDGVTRRDGPLPVNLSGGLKSKGHPIGATGIGQIVELFEQLRGSARDPVRQHPNARRALAHNVGGSGSSSVVTLLEADE